VWTLRANWFKRDTTTALSHELVIGVLLGVGCWLRPEGFVVAGLFHLVRGWRGTRTLTSALPLGLLAGALLLFHHHETGHWVPASGRARMLSGHLEAWQLGPLFVSPKPMRLLALYLPLSGFWLLGCWWLLRDHLQSAERRVLILSACISLSFFALYSTVLGAAHLGRYLIFVMPFVVIPAVLAAAEVWRQWPKLRAPLFTLAALWMLVIFGIEIAKRRHLGAAAEIMHAMNAPADRAGFSDRVYALLGQPAKRPIVLGLQEVQMRYWLDDRFLVRSLDGRTDPELLRHADRGGIDHAGYLRARGVDFVLETPNYNRDPTRWSLARLEQLQVGASTRAGGVTFTRLAGDPSLIGWIFQVTRDE
jgi:hypothetical protein